MSEEEEIIEEVEEVEEVEEIVEEIEEEEQEDEDPQDVYEQAVATSSEPEQIKLYRHCIQIEQPKAEWGFRSYIDLIKLYFSHSDYEEVKKAFNELLPYSRGAVERELFTKELNRSLDLFQGNDALYKDMLTV